MKSKLIGYAVSFLSLIMILSACGSKSGSNHSSSSTPADTTPVNEEGAFIATAKVDVLSESDLEYHVRSIFPVGIETEITYIVEPNQTYSTMESGISQADNKVYNPKITYSNVTKDSYGAIDSFEFTLSYFLPYSALPPDVAAQLQEKSSPSASSVRLMAETANSQSGVNVVAGGVMQEAGKKAVEYMIEQGFDAVPAKVINDTVGGALDVMSAWDMHNEHSDWMDRLDKIEDCVKNPSNPLDQKAYQEDSTLQQKHLDKINATRTEIKLNTGVRFINKISSVGLNITPAKVVWPIIAGGDAYTDDAMKQVNNTIVDALEKDMPTCINYYTGWFKGKSTLEMGDEFINVVDLQDITWKMTEHKPDDFTEYKMSRAGTVEVIIRGNTWEENCDPVDQYLNGIQFEGTLVVYDANRNDQYDNKYSWEIHPANSSIYQNVTAKCDHDNNRDTPRVPMKHPIVLHSHMSSCGYDVPPYDPLGKPDDMPEYSDVAILEGSGSWPCTYLRESASWSFLWSQLPE